MWVDLARARELKPFVDVDQTSLTHILSAACNTVENYIRYSPELQTYDELYQGTGNRSLFLKQFPVTAIQAVRYGRIVAIQIQNTDSTTQAAQVAITDTGITCSITNNATTTSNAFPYASYATMQSLADGINALGNGWIATLSPRFATWATQDLAVYATTQSARQVTALLSPHYYYLSSYFVHSSTGELVNNAGWYGGYQAFRVQYTAGYEVIPEELIQATCELAAATYLQAQSNPNYQSESLGVYSYSRAASQSLKNLSALSVQTLNYYKRAYVPYFRA